MFFYKLLHPFVQIEKVSTLLFYPNKGKSHRYDRSSSMTSRVTPQVNVRAGNLNAKNLPYDVQSERDCGSLAAIATWVLVHISRDMITVWYSRIRRLGYCDDLVSSNEVSLIHSHLFDHTFRRSASVTSGHVFALSGASVTRAIPS